MPNNTGRAFAETLIERLLQDYSTPAQREIMLFLAEACDVGTVAIHRRYRGPDPAGIVAAAVAAAGYVHLPRRMADLSTGVPQTVAIVDTLPGCESCSEPARYDVRTVVCGWGNYCHRCVQGLGCRLGTGLGQHLILESEVWPEIQDLLSEAALTFA